jgi:hypothetical protein
MIMHFTEIHDQFVSIVKCVCYYLGTERRMQRRLTVSWPSQTHFDPLKNGADFAKYPRIRGINFTKSRSTHRNYHLYPDRCKLQKKETISRADHIWSNVIVHGTVIVTYGQS